MSKPIETGSNVSSEELNVAKKDVKILYESLAPMVDEVVSRYTREVDSIIKNIRNNISVLTSKETRMYMLQLEIELMALAEVKDKSLMKQDCSFTLLKEAQAEIFNTADGTQGFKTNQSIIQTLEKQAIDIVYKNIASRFKSKLDEGHRLVSVLGNNLISMNAENKLNVLKGELENGTDLYNNNISEDSN